MIVIYEAINDPITQLSVVGNITAALLLFLVATVILIFTAKIKFHLKTDIVFIMVGTALQTFGWMIMAILLSLEGLFKIHENIEMVQWLKENQYLTIIPSIFVLPGLVLVIGPMISILLSCSRFVSYVITTAFVFSVGWFIFWKLVESLP